MANITFFNTGVDMTQLQGLTSAAAEVVSSSSTEVILTDSNGFGELDIFGKKFADFDDSGMPHSGKIKGMDLSLFGSEVASFSKLHLHVEDFLNYVAENDAQGLVDDILSGNDQIDGSTDDDVLTGLTGRDRIDGHEGDDVLIGGMGGDKLTGGDGSDVFLFSSTSESGKGGVDIINDLETSDTIDLSAIDADVNTDGDQEFHIVAKLKGHAGEMTVVYDEHRDRTIVSLDTDGDHKADGIIWITGDHHDYAGWAL
jgi:Ca2+-binding RTX toxin-like protein